MKYLDYVNIKQGTKSSPRYSHGNTLPLTQLPFAMASYSVQTDGGNEPWFYNPDSKYIEGIRVTHQPSPWIGDYGALLMTVQSGTPGTNYRGIWSGCDYRKSSMQPHHIDVKFLKYNTHMQLAPTERGAAIQIQTEDIRPMYFSLLSIGGKTSFSYDPKNALLYGYTEHIRREAPAGFAMYFVYRFNKEDIADGVLVSKVANELYDALEVEGENISIHIPIASTSADFTFATSYISHEQALLNLEQELNKKDVDIVKKEAQDIWEQYLSRIQIETYEIDQMHTFYSCLYRSLLFPHACHEYDKEGNSIHYCPYTGKTLPGTRYTDTGFWDSYRTQFPLLALIAKDKYKEMLDAFANDYDSSGWLQRWSSMDEQGCMPSTLIDAVIADAAVKNIADKEQLERLLEAMLKHANVEADKPIHGRNGVLDYLKYGYVSYESEKESVNLTLDAAYGDYCIAVTADALGKEEIVEEYSKRSYNYKNLFDHETGFMRAKNNKGEFRPNFNSYRWGLDYTEGSAWQNSFAVYHDLEGLAQLYGGKQQILEKLHSLFAAPPLYYYEPYGREIHEMTEMALADYGQCAISNQPSFHLPYMFAYYNDQESTDYWVKRMCNEVFRATPDGFPGDEDNGTMAAWYIFSMLGFYPICPGKAEYVKGPMQVKSAKILEKEWDNSNYGRIIPHSAFI